MTIFKSQFRKTKGYSIDKAAIQYKGPRATVQNYIKSLKENVDGENSVNVSIKKLGQICVLSNIVEQVLVDLLSLAAKWACPPTPLNVHVIARDYLNACPNRSVEILKNNILGHDWVEGFLKRHHELSFKFAENIKRSRAGVSRKRFTKYFKELQESLKNVEIYNTVNYDETCFVDDPKKKKRGTRSEIFWTVGRHQFLLCLPLFLLMLFCRRMCAINYQICTIPGQKVGRLMQNITAHHLVFWLQVPIRS